MRHGDDVTNTWCDVAVAAGTEIRLCRLIRLNKAGLGVGPEVERGAFGHSGTVCPAAGLDRQARDNDPGREGDKVIAAAISIGATHACQSNGRPSRQTLALITQ